MVHIKKKKKQTFKGGIFIYRCYNCITINPGNLRHLGKKKKIQTFNFLWQRISRYTLTKLFSNNKKLEMNKTHL